MNFQDWPQDFYPGVKTAGSRVKIEQGEVIDTKERMGPDQSR